MIHENSKRAEAVFLPVNCSAIPEHLMEAELFGHTKGAFTSAVSSQKGYFEIANRGTIFFDEIGTLGVDMQSKLLRVIQEKEFRPLGSTETVRVDVRILAATNADLRRLVEEGKFREDLYYRLNVINIVLPPLRERKEDVPLLVEHFFAKYCRENEKFLDAEERSMLRFEPEAMQILMDHNWPGNVRELENVIERAVVLASQQTVPVDVLPDYLVQTGGMRIRRDSSGGLAPDASLFEIVADFERRKIIESLEGANWSQTDAAEALHIPLSTLNQKIKRLEIQIKRRSA
jgi:transcriptional regulator with GAF, ATPase, and Fis domain